MYTWGNTFGHEDVREIPFGAVFLERNVEMQYVDGELQQPDEEVRYYRVLGEGEHREITKADADELALPARVSKRRSGDKEYNRQVRMRRV